MAITRRQFVTRLGALAATVGFSQAEVSQLAAAFAGNSNDYNGTFDKPRVIWIHGAECTGCSTSLLGILEDGDGLPFHYDSNPAMKDLTTADALAAAGVTNALGGAFPTLGGATRAALYGGDEHVNIADVVIDVIDLQYHETVMGMGGDLAAKWLQDFRDNGETAVPFVLVVEGALQDKRYGGAWADTTAHDVPWCSIGVFDNGTNEQDMPEVVAELSVMANCAAIIPIGQCACYGGFPGCKPQITSANAGFTATMSQTGAKGTYDFLAQYADPAAPVFAAAVNAAAAKVINVPGCPTNPWWFVLTVVMWMVDFANPGLLDMSLDAGRRLKKVYPGTVHSAFCPRYPSYTKGIYALKPGDPGCLQKIGCKGISASSLCGKHGWNNQQPENSGTLSTLNKNGVGGHCTVAGHPCMACTEKGYPDSFVPFVKR